MARASVARAKVGRSSCWLLAARPSTFGGKEKKERGSAVAAAALAAAEAGAAPSSHVDDRPSTPPADPRPPDLAAL